MGGVGRVLRKRAENESLIVGVVVQVQLLLMAIVLDLLKQLYGFVAVKCVLCANLNVSFLQQRDVHLRTTFLHHTSPSSASPDDGFLPRAVQAVLKSQSPSVAAQCLAAVMNPKEKSARENSEEFASLAKSVVVSSLLIA